MFTFFPHTTSKSRVTPFDAGHTETSHLSPTENNYKRAVPRDPMMVGRRLKYLKNKQVTIRIDIDVIK